MNARHLIPSRIATALFGTLLSLTTLASAQSEGDRTRCVYLDPRFEDPGRPLTREELRARRDAELARVLGAPGDCTPGAGTGAGAGGAGGSSGSGGSGSGSGTGTSRDAEPTESDNASQTPVASGDIRGTEPIETPDVATLPVFETEPPPSPPEPPESVGPAEPPEELEAVTDSNGRIPADIPPADNDGALAAQIRAAAISEEDPEKRERLWNEYRRIRGLRTTRK